MNDNDFCQMLLYSLINLICFLLNVIYLTALFNVRSQYKLLGIEKVIADDDYSYYSYYYDDDEDDEASDLEMYKNSYTATATLFAFNFLGFLGFMIVLLILINKIKVNRTNAEMNNAPAQLPPNSDDIRTDERMGNSENITNTNNNNQKDEEYGKLIKIMWLFFLFSQFVFWEVDLLFIKQVNVYFFRRQKTITSVRFCKFINYTKHNTNEVIVFFHRINFDYNRITRRKT